MRHVHIIGVCGTLMGAFASYLKRTGCRVTGSDQNIYPPMSDVLTKAGVELFSGYEAKNLTKFSDVPDLVVIGNVIPASNPEAIEARNGKYKVTSLPEAMEEMFLPLTTNCVVAGTHGKTTTSSLLAFTFHDLKLNPSYFIGGVSPDLPNSFHVSELKKGIPFVLEGDEYDTAFWDKVPKFNHYLPDHVILTSVEFDHADIYKDFAAVEKAFIGLMNRVRPNGHVIACGDHKTVRNVLHHYNGKKITYGLDPSTSEYTAREIRYSETHSTFSVYEKENKLIECSISLPGAHNVVNALSVFVECREFGKSRGLTDLQIRDSMARFRGVKRRQEIRGEIRGVIVMDDFAHHPTAVKETLKALKLRYPLKRLITVFEPRSATSRRKIFQKEYAEAFETADLIYIARPYDQSKISEAEQFSSDELVADLRKNGKESFGFSEVDECVSTLTKTCESGDLVAVLSNGGFNGFIPKLLGALSP